MNRIILIAVCLLAATPVLADGPTFPFDQPDEENWVPSKFFMIDLLDFGVFLPEGGWSQRAGTFTCILGPARFGIGAAECYGVMDESSFWAVLPMHVGVTIWSKPKATSDFWGAAPDIYVNVAGSLWQNSESSSWNSWPWPSQLEHDEYINVALCCDVDYYGVGMSARLGAYRNRWSKYESMGAVYFELQLRAGAFRIAF